MTRLMKICQAVACAYHAGSVAVVQACGCSAGRWHGSCRMMAADVALAAAPILAASPGAAMVGRGDGPAPCSFAA